MTRADPQLIAAARLVENLAYRLPEVHDHIAAELHRIDGIGSTASGADNGGGGASERTIRVLVVDDNGDPVPDVNGRRQYDDVPVTAVEDYALRRVEIHAHWADLCSHAKAIATITANALNDANRLLGHRIAVPVQRCDGQHLEGWNLPWPGEGWADAACDRPADKAGLCSVCYQRCRRWRLAHGLRNLRDALRDGAA